MRHLQNEDLPSNVILAIHSLGNKDDTGNEVRITFNSITMNKDCQKRLVEYVEHFVKRYEAVKSNHTNKENAIYFTNILKYLNKKVIKKVD
ncbi:hypothetical protein [Bacteroides faecichinchillae]|uniref:hypothetical protein n=1 Tax=Bacteroides faecichinchillae TaxID=871325 RepID=UPI003570DDB7